jgi:hypothetical protein
LGRELAAAKEGIAALMIKHGMATGHGDTCDDLLRLLDAELSAAKAEAADQLRCFRIAHDNAEKAKAEAEALREDAERYLWLAAQVDYGNWSVVSENLVYMDDKAHMDAAIDAARKG